MSSKISQEVEWQMAKSSLTERNKYMFTNPLISDVSFSVQDVKRGEMRTVPAHKYILSISSPVFFVMFYGAMPEVSDPIKIPDCDFESFLELLRFIYCDEVNLTESNVCLILYLSKKYLIPSLTGRCAVFMGNNLSAKTVFAVLPGVHISDDTSLLRRCWQKVDEKTTEAINSEAFLNISKELLCCVLKRDTLNASEVDLFYAVDQWCENQCKNQQVEITEENKRQILGNAVDLIRFPLMAQSEFASLMSKSKLLATEDVSNLFLYFNNALESRLKFSQIHRRAWSSYKDSWQFVYHNEADGSTLAGSKAALMAAVSSGARVRVFIEAFQDGGVMTIKRYSTEADNLSIYGGHVFAQLLQNVSKSSWDGFQVDAYWWWMIASTEGSVHAVSCYVGANTLRADSNPRARIKWFMKPVFSPAVYSNDKKGKPLAGSLEDFRSHVKKGCQVTGLNNKTFSFPAQSLTVQSDTGYVAGQNVDHVGQIMNSGQLKFQKNPYWCFSIVTTQGMRDISRWTVGSHQSRGHTGDEVATEWFVDTCWKHVYAHDVNGKAIAGSRDALVKAISAGQRVRFQIVDRNFFTAEADNVTIRNGHVTAQALKNLSKVKLAKFEDDLFWLWIIISTSGSSRITRYDVGDKRHRGDTISNFKINWFVDTRFWHPVLSHDADGTVLAGSREQLVRAVKDGASVRCAHDNAALDFCFQAQNLEISPDEQHVAAQTLNHVSAKEAPGPYEMEFQSNAYWFFSVVSTTGKRDISRWTVGKHEDRGHSSDRVATKWFVNH